MTVWAVVPVKPLRFGKSRLAQVLGEEERLALNHCLLANTLDILHTVRGLDQVLVISRDPQALTLARNHGARTVQENGSPHLNVALVRAMSVLHQYQISGALILPADLPLLSAADVEKLLAFATDPPVVAIAPDRRHEGTNALLVYPLNLLRFSYGAGSFERHCQLAQQAGARLEILDTPALALDVDLPEDLDLVRANLNCTLPI